MRVPEACDLSLATGYLPLSASFLSGDVTLETSGSISSALKPQHSVFSCELQRFFFFFFVVSRQSIGNSKILVELLVEV